MSVERIKEIEENMQDQLDINFYAIEKEDAHFLIDTVKQQNEQIEEITKLSDFHKNEWKMANKVIKQKSKRIQESEENLAHFKFMAENHETDAQQLREENERLQNLVQSLTEKNQSLGESDKDAANDR